MTTGRSLDHFAIAVRNADGAGSRYEALGFQVLPLMRHIELGSCNRIVQLHDTYIELVGDLDKAVPYLRDRMLPRFQCGDGIAISSITSSSLEDEHRRLANTRWKGDAIVNARRKVTMPDGTVDETDSRCIYVWRPERLYSMLFYSEHRKPHTIWTPAYQQHPNTARRVTAIVYVSNDPPNDGGYAADLLGYAPQESLPHRVIFRTPRGETIEYLSAEEIARRYGNAAPQPCATQPCLGVGLDIEVADLNACRRAMTQGSVAFETVGSKLRVPAAQASGVVLEFHAASL
ncbi:MAG: VOC family protein [Alphaproteobacteria bacterium]|nr:VOC family protein [Alphaproteobacteria bacterium]